MDFEIHSHDRPYVENGADFDANGIPRARERRGDYWGWCAGLLGLRPPASALLDSDETRGAVIGLDAGSYGVLMSDDERLAAMRRREQRIQEANAPPSPTSIGEVVSEVVSTVAGKVAKVTKTAAAVEWLATVLQQGPVAEKTVAELAKAAGFGTKPLKLAKQKLKVESTRKGRNHWAWQLPFADKLPKRANGR
jgi:hypothetical protein